jgi:hypothetical protein
MYFVFIDENGKMKPVKMVLRRRGEGYEREQWGGKSKVYCEHICKCHNVSSYTTMIG